MKHLPFATKELAAVHLANKQPTLCRAVATQARNLFRQTGEAFGEAAALELVMETHVMQQEAEQSLEIAEEIATIFRRKGWKRREARHAAGGRAELGDRRGDSHHLPAEGLEAPRSTSCSRRPSRAWRSPRR